MVSLRGPGYPKVAPKAVHTEAQTEWSESHGPPIDPPLLLSPPVFSFSPTLVKDPKSPLDFSSVCPPLFLFETKDARFTEMCPLDSASKEPSMEDFLSPLH